MTPPLSASLLALGLLVQSSPPSGAAGSAGAAGSGGVKTGDATSGATMKKPGEKRGHDLADLLLPLVESQHRSGSFGPASPPAGGDSQVSSPDTQSQWHPMIAVDPADRLHLIGAALDDRNYPGHHAGVFYSSFDGGQTWNELFRGADFGRDCNDTDAAFGAAGDVFYAYQRANGPDPILFVGRSLDGGLTVPTWKLIPKLGAKSCVQPELAVDRTTGAYAGNVYLVFVWTYYDEFTYTRSIAVSTSTDDGATWSTGTINFTQQFDFRMPTITVDSAGLVHVAYCDVTNGLILSDTSTNGSSSWGVDVQVAAVAAFAIPHLAASVVPEPRIASDTSGGPFDGTLYLTWAQDGGSDGPDVVLTRSTDHGATWSSPIVVSSVTTHSQFSPSIAVDPNGNLVVGFYDCRDDPNNTRVNFYVARSADGGSTFQPDVKVSSTDFDPTSYGDGAAILQRTGIAASDREVHALWTDGRNGDNDVFTASANLSLFTDVATISAATGGTASFTVDPGPLFQLTEYHVLGSLSGTTPGTDFYFEDVPVNYDLFTLATIYEANGPIFPGFTGNLDTAGAATAQLVSGPLPPALIGVQMDFAALVRVAGAVRWGSAPTRVEIGN